MDHNASFLLDADDPFTAFNISQLEASEEVFTSTSGTAGAIATAIFVLLELIKLAVCASSVGASVLLIHVLAKFKDLTPKHFFILHYAIVSLVDMLFVPLFELVKMIFIAPSRSHAGLVCMVYQVNYSSMLCVLLFGAAIGLHWALETFQSELLQKIPQLPLIFIATIYLLATVKFVLLSIDCFVPYYFFSNYFIFALYSVLLVGIVGVNIAAYRRPVNALQLKTKYLLTLSTYLTMSWFPVLVAGLCFEHFYANANRFILYFFEFGYYFCEYFAYCGTVATAYWLGRSNKYFRMAYDTVFKKRVKNYGQEDLDGGSEEEGEEAPRRVNGGGVLA